MKGHYQEHLPKATLHDATRKDAVTLGHLMQFYSYDFSEIIDLDVNEEGLFAEQPLNAYWLDDWRHAFLIRVEAKLAGFALVHERSRLTQLGGVFDMAEFFVMRKFRGRGVGACAALACFGRFRGNWEIRQRASNEGATHFWRRVIDRYTRGHFNEVLWDDSIWKGPVQFFSSRSTAAETAGG